METFKLTSRLFLLTLALASAANVSAETSVSTTSPNEDEQIGPAAPAMGAKLEPKPESRAPSDIVIVNSLEDGLLAYAGQKREQHLYEEQAKQQSGAPEPERQVAMSESKPEPRNQQDEQPTTNQQQHQEQLNVIIDHRPNQKDSLDQELAMTQQPASIPTTQAPHTVTLAPAPLPAQPATLQASGQSQNSIQNQWANQQQPSMMNAPQQIQQAASNQVFSIQPHPNSINAIINDQQQQPHQIPTQQQPANSQQLNGQPATSVGATTYSVLMNPQGGSSNNVPIVASSLGSRRISISNWLKGLSNMLANIFNRREHMNLNLMASPSNGSPIFGQWLGNPNNVHWLSQAQNAIQMQQQQFQQFGANQMNPAQTLASANNRFAAYNQAPGGGQQQSGQQPTMTITLQPGPMVSQQQQGPVGAGLQGDMMQSSSAPSYVQVQPPATMFSGGQQNSPTLQLAMVGKASSSNQARAAQTMANLDQQQQQSVKQVTNNSATGAAQQQLQQPAQQTRSNRSLVGNSNLPLAHYSRYGNSGNMATGSTQLD